MSSQDAARTATGFGMIGSIRDRRGWRWLAIVLVGVDDGDQRGHRSAAGERDAGDHDGDRLSRMVKADPVTRSLTAAPSAGNPHSGHDAPFKGTYIVGCESHDSGSVCDFQQHVRMARLIEWAPAREVFPAKIRASLTREFNTDRRL